MQKNGWIATILTVAAVIGAMIASLVITASAGAGDEGPQPTIFGSFVGDVGAERPHIEMDFDGLPPVGDGVYRWNLVRTDEAKFFDYERNCDAAGCTTVTVGTTTTSGAGIELPTLEQQGRTSVSYWVLVRTQVGGENSEWTQLGPLYLHEDCGQENGSAGETDRDDPAPVGDENGDDQVAGNGCALRMSW